MDSGYTKVLQMSNKLEAITALCVHPELAKENPVLMKQIFVAGAFSLSIDAETFKELLVFEDVDANIKDMFLRYIETEG